LRTALDTFKDYISRETLATSMGSNALGTGAATTAVEIEDDHLVIELRRATVSI